MHGAIAAEPTPARTGSRSDGSAILRERFNDLPMRAQGRRASATEATDPSPLPGRLARWTSDLEDEAPSPAAAPSAAPSPPPVRDEEPRRGRLWIRRNPGRAS